MRFFALAAVALAVVPSALAFPVFKRSDTLSDVKDQKSARAYRNNVYADIHINGPACQTAAINYNDHSTNACNWQALDSLAAVDPYGNSYPGIGGLSNILGKEAKKGPEQAA